MENICFSQKVVLYLPQFLGFHDVLSEIIFEVGCILRQPLFYGFIVFCMLKIWSINQKWVHLQLKYNFNSKIICLSIYFYFKTE